MPDEWGNATTADMAEQARQAAALRMRQSTMRQQPYQQPQVPQDYQSWGNLAETTARAFPNFQNWTPGQGPPPQSEIEKVIGLAGIMGRPYDQGRFDLARQLERQGASPGAIWQQTQTARGIGHKQWQQEIPGRGNVIGTPGDFLNNLGGPVRNVFSYPELYRHYPQIGEYPVFSHPDLPGNAGFLPAHPADPLRGGQAFFINPQRFFSSPQMSNSAMTHEMTHAVDELSGFPLGQGLNTIAKQIHRQKGPAWQEYLKARQQYPGYHDDVLRAQGLYATYARQPSEIRARLSEYRMPMSEKARRYHSQESSLAKMLEKERARVPGEMYEMNQQYKQEYQP